MIHGIDYLAPHERRPTLEYIIARGPGIRIGPLLALRLIGPTFTPPAVVLAGPEGPPSGTETRMDSTSSSFRHSAIEVAPCETCYTAGE